MKNIILFGLSSAFFFSNLSAFAQGGETVAAAAAVPVTLPFSAAGTTVGKVDNYNDVTTGFPVGEITGPDWLYYFCATSTSPIVINLEFTPIPSTGLYPSISVWDGDPNTTGNLVAYTSGYGIDASTIGTQFTPTSGQCYYAMVDNWPTPNGFPYTIYIQNPPTPPAPVLEPSCSNMGFEDGNFTGWQGSWSNMVSTSAAGSPTPTYTPFYYNTTSTQHLITSGAGTDPVAGFPIVCPGQGNNSLRLGDGLIGERGGATIQQRFSVNASNALFTYNYAVIVEDGGFGGGTPHSGANQPFFKVEIFDDVDAIIPCGQYFVTGGPGIPGFTQVAGTGVYYKGWTPVFVDLTAYVGSFVTVKYTVNDCSLGAHSCYAYIDAACAPMVVPATTFICPAGSGTLTSPLSGDGYSWTVQGNATVLGTSSTLSVSPVVATTYQCVITNASGCNTTLLFPVDIYAAPTVTSTSTIICAGSSGSITATGVPGGGTYSWSPGAIAGATLTQSPAVTTIYTCTYTNTDGCDASGPGTITVDPLPAAPTPDPISYCLNDPAIPLTATADPDHSLNWYGTAATGGVASSGAPTPLTNTAGPTTYYVSQTNTTTGCEGPRASLVVTVNALPTITVNSPSVCPGVSATLTAVGGSTYDWEAGTFIGNPYSVSPATTTNYTVEGTDASGCKNTAVATVTIAGTLTVTVNSETICEGASTTLTASGGTTYSWDDGVTAGVATTPSYTVSPTSTTVYTVTGTTGGCSGTANSTVTVNVVPTTTAGSNSPICAGAALDLTAFPSGVAGSTYSWTGPNSYNSTLQDPTIAGATVAATGNYVVTVTANGCSSNSNVAVTVNPIPTTTASSNSPVCVGEALNLSAASTIGATYSWTGPNLYTSALQNPSIPVTSAANTGNYIVTILLNGCSSTSSTAVVINAIPTTVAGSNSPICEGASLNLTATASAGSTYSWTGPNLFTSTSQDPTIGAATPAATGNYIVTVSANGCSSTSNVNVVVNSGPTTVASSNPVCEGDNLQVTATNSTVPGSTYSWSGPNLFSSSLQSPTIVGATAVDNGLYTVTVSAAGCSSSSSVTAVVNAPVTPNIQISPNVICEGTVAPILLLSSADVPAITGTWFPTSVDVTASGSYTFTPDPGQCALPVTRTVTVNPGPVLAVANPAAVCVPNTVNLTAASVTAGSSGGTITYWQNAQCTVPLVSPSAVGTSGTYFILSSTASTPVCTEVVPVTVQINTGPVADFTATPTVLSNMNPYSVMQNTSIGAVSYLWDFGDNSMASTLENPDHYFPYSDSGTYLITLIAMDQNSCVDTAYASVQVSEELIFYVPNTFTPDHDSFNETFLPIFTSGYDPYNYTLLIFDRWGEVVFESHNAEVGWKGTYGPDNIVVQDDTYTWKISFKLKMNNQVKTIVGHVNVLK